MIKEKIKQFTKLESEIHQHFKYQEDWVKIPIEEQLDSYWMLCEEEEEDGGGFYCISPEPFTEESVSAGKVIYGGRIYTQRFLPKWVYRADDCTMVCVDTQTDGNKFLYLFDNELECKDEKLKELYLKSWVYIK